MSEEDTSQTRLPPRYRRVYICEGMAYYLTNKPLEYEPYMLVSLIIDFDENETYESYREKQAKAKEKAEKFDRGELTRPMDLLVIGLVCSNTPDYHRLVDKKDITIEDLPDGSVVFMVITKDGEVAYVTSNRNLAYKVKDYVTKGDGGEVREVTIPYGAVTPIPDKKSIRREHNMFKLHEYLVLFGKHIVYILKFLIDPEGEEYPKGFKVLYQDDPELFTKLLLDDVKKLEAVTREQIFMLDKDRKTLKDVSACTRHPEIKEHTKGAYLAELSILTACYFHDIPVEGGLSVWFKTLGDGEINKYNILLKDPKSNKLKILLHMYNKVAEKIHNYEYCTYKINMIANLFFTGFCNCVCGTILMETLAEYTGIKNVFSAMVPGHILNLFIDQNEVYCLESTNAGEGEENNIEKYIVSLPSPKEIDSLLVTPKLKVFRLLQETLNEYIIVTKSVPKRMLENAIAIWRDIFGDRYPEVVRYYEAIINVIFGVERVENETYVNFMESFEWKTDTLEDLFESIYMYTTMNDFYPVFYDNIIVPYIDKKARKLSKIGTSMYRYYFIDYPNYLKHNIPTGDYKYSVLSTITSHEGKDFRSLLPEKLSKPKIELEVLS